MSTVDNVTKLAVAAGIGLVAGSVGWYIGLKTRPDVKMRKSGTSTDPLYQYIMKHSIRVSPAQEKLIKTTQAHPRYRMLGSVDAIQLLANLAKAIGAKKTLDVGVYTGYSSLSIALVLPDDGKVVACDISDEFVNIGKPFWKEAGVYDKIDLRIAPAIDTLNQLIKDGEEGSYDYAFIDADKVNYWTYYELCLRLLRKGGIIAVDNVLWGGSVIDPEKQDDDTIAIRDFNRRLVNDKRVDISMISCGDGTTLAFKR